MLNYIFPQSMESRSRLSFLIDKNQHQPLIEDNRSLSEYETPQDEKQQYFHLLAIQKLTWTVRVRRELQ